MRLEAGAARNDRSLNLLFIINFEAEIVLVQ